MSTYHQHFYLNQYLCFHLVAITWIVINSPLRLEIQDIYFQIKLFFIIKITFNVKNIIWKEKSIEHIKHHTLFTFFDYILKSMFGWQAIRSKAIWEVFNNKSSPNVVFNQVVVAKNESLGTNYMIFSKLRQAKSYL